MFPVPYHLFYRKGTFQREKRSWFNLITKSEIYKSTSSNPVKSKSKWCSIRLFVLYLGYWKYSATSFLPGVPSNWMFLQLRIFCWIFSWDNLVLRWSLCKACFGRIKLILLRALVLSYANNVEMLRRLTTFPQTFSCKKYAVQRDIKSF